MLGTARRARLDRDVTVTALNGAQLHLRAPRLDREAVLTGRIIEVPGTVVAMGEEELALIMHFAAGVQAVDDVPPEPVHRRGDQAVVRAHLIPQPGPQPRPGHRIGGTGDFPVIGPSR